MRFVTTCCLLFIVVLAGCAYEGTVVRKEFRPLPFIESLGVEGIYKFELRDRAGRIHSQMVTGYVFSSYEVGEYFNDLQPIRADRYLPGIPLPPVPGPFRQTPEYEQIPYQPVRTTSAPSPVHRKASAKKLAVRRHTIKTAARTKHGKSRKKIVRSHRTRSDDQT